MRQTAAPGDAARTVSESATGPITRRNFVTAGAAGLTTGALLGTAGCAQSPDNTANADWDHEYDVVVVGAGCAGLTSAIRARDLGASVLIVEASHDVGGRMLNSGSFVSLGGGDAIQQRDLRRERDAEGRIQVDPIEQPAALDDNVELLFRDLTDWSIVDRRGYSPYRYNEREVVRAWAENCPPTREFLMSNHVRFARINATHTGGGMSRARGCVCFLVLGDKTDMKAGTITAEDAGHADPERTSPFAPVQMDDATQVVGPGTYSNGVALARPLEFSAREKGVLFMLNRGFDELIREQPSAGRILGITASYSPRQHPETGEPLQSYWNNGNIDEQRPVVRIRARRAVILACGGHSGNPEVRSMFHPGMREPLFPTSCAAALGPRVQDASAIQAGLKIGANLAGMQQNLVAPSTYQMSARLGTPDAYTPMMPGHPTFGFRGSTGVSIGRGGFEQMIAVNQVGKRFFNEVRLMSRVGSAHYPSEGVTPGGDLGHKPHDWHNCSHEWIKQTYSYDHGIEAALAVNEGSTAPNYYSGPLWAIFDQAAADRMGLKLRFPYIADNGFSFQADSVEELAAKISAGNKFQRVPVTHLANTVSTWNSYVQRGADPDFAREKDGALHPITKGPFHALSLMIVWHDSYGGLRVNGKQQVIDMQGAVIPGLFAGGEAAGGFDKHGLGKGTVQGFIAGTHAVEHV
ncbi:MAG: FAD-dependent oxidoreductase [Nevskiaceae bacterium]|nr:FAD-dependent oxidoreductase [Nevskiaceae bacterium]